jgi:hypothetical protein
MYYVWNFVFHHIRNNLETKRLKKKKKICSTVRNMHHKTDIRIVGVNLHFVFLLAL